MTLSSRAVTIQPDTRDTSMKIQAGFAHYDSSVSVDRNERSIETLDSSFDVKQ